MLLDLESAIWLHIVSKLILRDIIYLPDEPIDIWRNCLVCVDFVVMHVIWLQCTQHLHLVPISIHNIFVLWCV